MENPTVRTLTAAIATAPFAIERERYRMAIDEILKLERIIQELRAGTQ